MRGVVLRDMGDIRDVGYRGVASAEGNTGTWPRGRGLCFCGTQTYFCLTELESDYAEPGKEKTSGFFSVALTHRFAHKIHLLAKALK